MLALTKQYRVVSMWHRGRYNPQTGGNRRLITLGRAFDLRFVEDGLWFRFSKFAHNRLAVMLRIWLRRVQKRLNQVRIINAITYGDRENKMSWRALYGYN